MPDDVLLNKVAAIERALIRIGEEYAGEDANLFDNRTRQDAILLNLQRACESAIDLAMHLVRSRRLGIPQESRDAFAMLAAGGVLDTDLATRLQKMVGFRNIAVHDYERLNLVIVRAILTSRLSDFERFCRRALELL
ncbi:MAG: type VII toxin-antitoxin system HepT family RNase toxin [Bacteroidales bacterium]